MKLIRTVDAVNHVLCHDLTQIVPGEYKGPRFRKGHIVTEEDIPILLSMGKENLYIYELQEGMLHENDAAERMCALCLNVGMERGEAKEGKIEIRSAVRGVFLLDREKLKAINSIDELLIATRHGDSAVEPGDKLCGTRVIPLVIDEKKILEAETICGGVPLMQVRPYIMKKAGIVTTGSEVLHGRIEDRFTPVIEKKLEGYGIRVTEKVLSGDGVENVSAAIRDMRGKGLDIIVCTGGMSVDPDDNTPGAIRASGAEVVTYGAPVLPGAMMMLGYFGDGVPILGLPGCVMYSAFTIFDLVMPRIAAGVRLTKQDFVALGEGGLCLGCKPCTYPRCPFGK